MDRLGEIEQQMSAIQHRDGKQVDQTKIDRKHGDERHQARQAKLRHLTGELGDPQRATKLFGPTFAAHHLRNALDGLLPSPARSARPPEPRR